MKPDYILNNHKLRRAEKTEFASHKSSSPHKLCGKHLALDFLLQLFHLWLIISLNYVDKITKEKRIYLLILFIMKTKLSIYLLC